MIDNLVKQLDSPDPEKRKKAVMALAKTKDPSVLRFLAAVARTDEDDEVRDLAVKAGRYIKKQTEGADAAPGRPSGRGAAPYPDEDEAAREPLPEEIVVSQADIDRAKGLIQQALDWHMREDNDKAAQYLSRAFSANPKLKYDSYTTGLAATITGRPSDEAVRLLAPSPEELRKRRAGARGTGAQASSTQRTIGLFVALVAAVLLVSYLTFPWVDLAPLPVVDPQGANSTFGAMFDASLEQVRAPIEAVRSTLTGDAAAQADKALSAINGIKINFTGLDTTLATLNFASILDIMNMKPLFELSGQPVPDIPVQEAPRPLDYTLLLVPVLSIIMIVLGLILLTRRASATGLWILVILIGLVGVVPFWWFFTDTRQSLLRDSSGLGAFGNIAIGGVSTGTEIISIGFWISLVAQVALICLPFIALLSAPSSKEE